MMIAETLSLCIGLLAAFGEYLHTRRCRRAARLAFGPGGSARAWTAATPFLRVLALMTLTWGLVQLWMLVPRGRQLEAPSATADRHLVLALDVSPSMQLKDAGVEHRQSRAQRASDVVLSILQRADLNRLRMSVVAFYTGAKPVVVDTFDVAIIKNVLDDLPLELAFDPGKTSLLDGVRESAALARDWPPSSTTLVVVSDGDTVPDTGLTRLPPAIRDALVLGVGSSSAGISIDGHLSRQDGSTLRQLAARLGGNYFDTNEKHLPSRQLTTLARALPTREDHARGRREWSLAAVAVGAVILALLPVALAAAGSPWRPRSHVSRRASFDPIGPTSGEVISDHQLPVTKQLVTQP